MMKTKTSFPFAGIPTFMRADYRSMGELDGYDVGVVGVPYDIDVSYRVGARLGPRAIRSASLRYPLYKKGTYFDLDIGSRQVEVAPKRIADVGDLEIFPTDERRNRQSIQEGIAALSRRVFPLILGGAHSITYPAFLGFREAMMERGKGRVGLIHFDAHVDVWDTYLTLGKYWHGSQFRRLIEDGALDPRHMVSIGIRGLLNPEVMAFIDKYNISLFTLSDVEEQGIEVMTAQAIEIAGTDTEAIYLTVDIDVLDPAFAPGTGTPAPGGLTSRQMLKAITLLAGANVGAFDLVEVAPPYDPTERTAIAAAELLWRFLMLKAFE